MVGYLLFAFARSLPMLFVARLLPGATGGNIGTAQAVIADSTAPSERARGMAMVGIAFGLGFIFGPAIGGFAVHLGESAPGLFAAGLSARRVRLGLLQAARDAPRGDGRAVRPALLGRAPLLRRSGAPRSAPSCSSPS